MESYTQPQASRFGTALLISFIRLPLLLIGAAATLGLLAVAGRPLAFPPAPDLASLYFIVVNAISLVILRRIVHREGRTLHDLLGFSRARMGKDILWGLLWVAVLYLPFAAAVIGTMAALYGPDTFTSFERVFAPAETSAVTFSPAVTLTLALATAILFPLLNAPAEELYYRGYAQPALTDATGKPWLGVLIPTIGFSVQHILLAPTMPGMLVYAVAFFVWGLGASLIYARQRRLMPLVVAHFCTNFFFGLAPLIIFFAT
jgi:membrane protease YdiL (CAAX protease family)